MTLCSPRWLLLCLLAILLAQPALAAPAQSEYMAVYIHGVKIGYTESKRTVEGQKVHNLLTVILSTKSGGWHEETLETLDGKPLSVTRQRPDGSALVQILISRGQMQIRRETDGSVTTTKQPYPAHVLLTEGAERLMKSHGLLPGTTYSYIRFDSREIKPITVTIEVGPLEDVTILDHVEKLHRVSFREEGLVSTIYMTDTFDAHKILQDAGLQFEMVRCSKELALSPNAPLNLDYLRNLPLPNDLPHYRSAMTMRIVLVPDGKTTFTIPSTAAQSATRRADGSFEIIVRASAAPPACPFPYTGSDPEIKAALEPSEAYPCRDPQMLNSARLAIGSCQDANGACKLLETWVRNYIVFKVESDDETATAILAHRNGNCRQHAILLLTLARALGIPAREVVGMAYVGGKQLSGHAWVECYIGGQWVDYDAALDGFDVAHLALWTGAGELDGRDILAKFGHLQVTQVELELPWYMRYAWPMATLAALLLITWLLYRRHSRRYQPTDWPAFPNPQPPWNSPNTIT